MVKIIDDIIVVFLMEFSYKDENLEDEFKNLLDKLNKVYNIDIKGSYKINLYKDKIYGAVLEIIKDSDYYDYFNAIDLTINIIDSHFLYEINDYIYNLNSDIYLYNNKIYVDINNKKDLYKVLEYSTIIYKENSIIKNGKKINNML
ncbi:MAG: hypothetical protein MRZ34_05630 [Bacillales bacterium]|nr:hypothetical protein [Bacillales bacterium]